MSETRDPALRRRHEIRQAVRITSERLEAGMIVTPWNDRSVARRAVAETFVLPDGRVVITWADGSAEITGPWQVWHRRISAVRA